MHLRKTLLACGAVFALLVSVRPAHARFMPRLGAITLGGGVANFVKGQTEAQTTPGGAADARLTIGTGTPLAFEVNYLVTLSREHVPTGFNPPELTTSTLSGNGRVNFTLWRVQPFLTAGAGWVNLHSFGRDIAPTAATHFKHDINAVAIPLGGGVATYLGSHAVLDARFNYQLIADKDFTSFHERPDMWNATLNAGYSF